MEMKYVDKMDTNAAEPMALKVTVEPMLINDKRQVIVKVIKTALRGMFQPGFTCVIILEKGRPLSRAKAQVCRLTVATVEMQADVMFIIIRAVRIEAPTWELVEL